MCYLCEQADGRRAGCRAASGAATSGPALLRPSRSRGAFPRVPPSRTHHTRPPSSGRHRRAALTDYRYRTSAPPTPPTTTLCTTEYWVTNPQRISERKCRWPDWVYVSEPRYRCTVQWGRLGALYDDSHCKRYRSHNIFVCLSSAMDESMSNAKYLNKTKPRRT